MGAGGGSLSQALLCATSLGCALRARQVTAGPAAGFLLQALAAASDALAPLWPLFGPGGPAGPDPLPGSWVSSVLAQPLVAFGFHRLSGDRATANLLLATGTLVAPVAAGLPADGRSLAGHSVTALVAGSVLALAALTGNAAGVVAAVLVAAGDVVAPWGVPWVRAVASVALLRALRQQSRGCTDQ